jgi:parvulin-like peptidyl-prolyl isomerase
MKKLLHEPLVHFILLGALVFTGFKFFSKNESNPPGAIVVTQGKIESLVTGFTRTWQRPPTREELNGLIRDYVREEVCAREAMALGLDKEDTVIRRRLRQKLEFISESVAAQANPTDAELQKYLEAHREKFRRERQFTFRQVYLDPQRHGINLNRDAAQLLIQLQQAGNDSNISVFGDPFLLDQEYKRVPTGEVSKQFGEKFAATLGDLPVGQWQGPIESGYGTHLVLILDRDEGRMPVLKEVRDAVKIEWSNAQRSETNEKFYEALLKRYTVTIEDSLYAKSVRGADGTIAKTQ